ncbi:MAG: YraN family protein [Nitrospiraceae bacterium]|nr:YraN family protein [Nitrospiraceae bacterium]
MNIIGKQGEAAALAFLRKSGYHIIATNYKTCFGEVDIIAKEKNVTIFVEVKSRSGSAFGHPFEAVTPKKQEKIRKVALFYMKQKKVEIPVRFDVLSINIAGGEEKIEHIRDAF